MGESNPETLSGRRKENGRVTWWDHQYIKCQNEYKTCSSTKCITGTKTLKQVVK